MTAEELLAYFEKLAAMFKPNVTVNVSYSDNRVEKDESTYVDKNFMGEECGCDCHLCGDDNCTCVCRTCDDPNCTCTCHNCDGIDCPCICHAKE